MAVVFRLGWEASIDPLGGSRRMSMMCLRRDEDGDDVRARNAHSTRKMARREERLRMSTSLKLANGEEKVHYESGPSANLAVMFRDGRLVEGFKCVLEQVAECG